MSIEQARRMALVAQGFGGSKPARSPNRRSFAGVLRTMGLLQLDSVQYLCRSHYLPVFSRLGPYSSEGLDRYTHQSDAVFEAWAHEASLIPMEHEPLWRWHKERSRRGEGWAALHRFAEEQRDYVDEVVEEVRARGALRAGELRDPRRRSGAWWEGRSGGKLALEWLFRVGVLGARRDEKFCRVYDLSTRMIPAEIQAQPSPEEERAHRELLLMATRAHGIGTLDCLADYYRIKKSEARSRIRELVEEGAIVPLRVEGWKEEAYALPATRTAKKVDRSTVLSPFDPVVWNRKRAKRLFGFDYRIEIYVPEAKRLYGYYVLPFLMDQRLVARVEIKRERKEGTLRVVGAWLEQGEDHRKVARALADNLRELADHLQLDGIRKARRGNLARELSRALSQ